MLSPGLVLVNTSYSDQCKGCQARPKSTPLWEGATNIQLGCRLFGLWAVAGLSVYEVRNRPGELLGAGAGEGDSPG